MHLTLLPKPGEGLHDGELADCSAAVDHGHGCVHSDKGPPPSTTSMGSRSSYQRGGIGVVGGSPRGEHKEMEGGSLDCNL